MLENVKLSFVKSTSVGRSTHTYDIEVDSEMHAFVAKGVGNGIGVSHNSALISLSNLSDDRMRNAKTGQWWVDNVQRALANNSAVYTERPDIEIFMKEWLALIESKSGERGIVNRGAIQRKIKDLGVRDANHDFGLNPCVSGDMVLDIFVDHSYHIRMDAVDVVSLFDKGHHVSIKAVDLEKGDIGYYPMSAAVKTKENAKLLKITDSETGKFIRVTEDHLVYTKNRGYIEAKNLVATDELLVIESPSGKSNILHIEEDGYEDVYDFSVPHTENFFANDILVHNCAEIFLRPAGFCNLSTIIIRESDTLESLKEKVELATILGTFQSTLTNFRYLRPIWKKNAEEERLLGVSMTGIMDHPVLSRASNEAASWLRELKQVATQVNKELAEKLGINSSVAITTIKPEGTTSELTQTSSGIHPKYSEYYIRTVRGSNEDPITKLMIAQGVPHEPDVTKPEKTTVFSFPVYAGSNGIKRDDMTAVQQLEHQKMFNENWCDHNTSITVYVREEEWLEVGSWIYKNWNNVYATSFLPHSDHVYAQAPFQEINKDQYDELLVKMPTVDWNLLSEFEKEDNTENQQTLACVSGVCSII